MFIAFEKYFSQGMTAAQALHFHQTKLWTSEGLSAVANTSSNPTSTVVYHLWRKWRQQEFGSFVGDDMFKCFFCFFPHFKICETVSSFQVVIVHTRDCDYAGVDRSNICKSTHMKINFHQ